MADVARLAGVSHQTVSRVLNNHPNVRPETRERVLVAVDTLHYRRNPAARALVTSRTQMLGVVAFGTRLHGPASTLYGIEQAAREAGYFVSVASLEEISRETVGEAIDVLADQSPDGIVVIAPQDSAADALDRIPADMPAVAVEGGVGTAAVPVVCVDQEQGARLATAHLLDLGHRTVHHLAGPPSWLEAEARVRGWRSQLESFTAAVPDLLRGDWSPRSGYEAGLELVRRADVTAVFAANDQMALGLLRAFREAGVRVPGDVSLVGFDDLPEAAYFPPPLTTVAQDFSEVGRRSIEVLLELVDTGAVADPNVVIPAKLVIRDSTAPRTRPRRETPQEEELHDR